MPYKDMTFCVNNDCNKRSVCIRAIENYENLDENNVYSWAKFDCDDKKIES